MSYDDGRIFNIAVPRYFGPGYGASHYLHPEDADRTLCGKDCSLWSRRPHAFADPSCRTCERIAAKLTPTSGGHHGE